MGYEVWGNVESRTFRVLWALEELGLDYSHHPERPHAPGIRALNRSGKVPVLVAEGAALTDSVAILAFLADRHGLLAPPAGTLDRARHDALAHRVVDEIETLVWMAARHSFVLPAERRVPEIKPFLKWDWEQALGPFEPLVAQGALWGEGISVADILLVHCLDWGRAARFPDPPPGVTAYAERMRDRPAYRRVPRA